MSSMKIKRLGGSPLKLEVLVSQYVLRGPRVECCAGCWVVKASQARGRSTDQILNSLNNLSPAEFAWSYHSSYLLIDLKS